jgi:drug/metabolite transporter (DMT)-like permease
VEPSSRYLFEVTEEPRPDRRRRPETVRTTKLKSVRRIIIGALAAVIFVGGLLIAGKWHDEGRWLHGEVPPVVGFLLIVGTAVAAALASFCFTRFGNQERR